MNKLERNITGLLGGLKIGDLQPVRIMGVINLTKNSFYPGSVKVGKNEILDSALDMERAGADVIDLGARSTAPYRKSEISEETETRLIRDSTRLLLRNTKVPISVDTTRLEPAKAGLHEGATILNDVYGLRQKQGQRLAKIASKYDCTVILSAHEMHRGNGPPLERITSCLKESLETARGNSINEKKLIVDPGIGFFKDKAISNVEWNSQVISNLEDLKLYFNLPVCVGVSRKSFIGMILGEGIPPERRLSGSLAAIALAVYNGCHVVRTHDVAESLDAVKVASEIRKRAGPKRLSLD